MPKREKVVEAEHAKCSSCGANLRFDPEKRALVCDHCGSESKIIERGRAKELDILSGFSSDRTWKNEDASSFRCANCGAEIILTKGETAKICPFCGTAHVEKTEELTGIKPNAVLPFSFGKGKAEERGKLWAKNKFFAPSKFKKSLKAEEIQGVYMPCFTFDSQTYSYYEGRLGKTRVVVTGSGKNRRTHTYVEWFRIHGNYSEFFDDVLVTAGEKFDQKKLDKVSPFDTNGGSEYDGKYLLGFMAYRYDREIESCWDVAKDKIDAVIKKTVLSKYSYDVVDYVNVSTKHEKVTFKYVMLPVYVGHFTYGKKLFNFYVNGTTGKVFGKTPVSPWRVLFAVLAGLALLTGLIFFAQAVFLT